MIFFLISRFAPGQGLHVIGIWVKLFGQRSETHLRYWTHVLMHIKRHERCWLLELWQDSRAGWQFWGLMYENRRFIIRMVKNMLKFYHSTLPSTPLYCPPRSSVRSPPFACIIYHVTHYQCNTTGAIQCGLFHSGTWNYSQTLTTVMDTNLITVVD